MGIHESHMSYTYCRCGHVDRLTCKLLFDTEPSTYRIDMSIPFPEAWTCSLIVLKQKKIHHHLRVQWPSRIDNGRRPASSIASISSSSLGYESYGKSVLSEGIRFNPSVMFLTAVSYLNWDRHCGQNLSVNKSL